MRTQLFKFNQQGFYEAKVYNQVSHPIILMVAQTISLIGVAGLTGINASIVSKVAYIADPVVIDTAFKLLSTSIQI